MSLNVCLITCILFFFSLISRVSSTILPDFSSLGKIRDTKYVSVNSY